MIKLKQLLAETAYTGSIPPQGTPVVSTTDLTKLKTQLAAAEAVTQGLQSQIDGIADVREIIAAQKLVTDTELLITSFETKIKEQCSNLKQYKPSPQRRLCKEYYENLRLLNKQVLNLKAGIVPDSAGGDEVSDEGDSFRRKKLTPEERTGQWVVIAGSILGLLHTIKELFTAKTTGANTGDPAVDDGLG